MDYFNININFIAISNEPYSGTSFILPSSKNRTILTYKGSNAAILKEEIPFEFIKKNDLLYLAPLSGSSSFLFDEVISFAKENKILVATNPSGSHLKKNPHGIWQSLDKIDFLISNRLEASILYSNIKNNITLDTDQKVKEFILLILDKGTKIVAITSGAKGVYIGFQNKVFFISSLPAKVKNTVGAGDAFAACFVGSILNFGLNIDGIKKAALYGLLNSSSVVESLDAQSGILDLEQLQNKATKTTAVFNEI